MRKSKTLASGLLLASVLLLTSCVTPLEYDTRETLSDTETGDRSTDNEDVTNAETDGPSLPVENEREYEYDAMIDESVLDTDYDAKYLVIANKTQPLGKNYKPSNLVKLTCNTTYEMELEARAAAALYQMLREMEADGLDVKRDIAVTSAYRSYQLQEELFSEYVDYELNYPGGFSPDAYRVLGYSYIQSEYVLKGIAHLSEADVLRVVSSYSARAGRSEHQTGLCVDFITKDMNNSLTVAFEKKPVFSWLSKYAHTFGFILRYPKAGEDATGYMYEPWHYRFVGREAATEIYERGIVLEKYVSQS